MIFMFSRHSLRIKGTEEHSRPTLLSNFILGSQDGLVNVLGIILGVTAATSDVRIIFVAALAALGAESISMGAVAYTSTLARRRHYLKEVEREKREIVELPRNERQEIYDIFKKWGYKGRQLIRATDVICSNPKAMLEFMMAHELNLSPVDKSEARNSFIVVFSSTVIGSIVPLVPFIFLSNNLFLGDVASIALSGVVLFAVGAYEAKTTVGSLWRSGLQMAIIGLSAGIIGYLIGHFVGAVPI
ncbi:MAG: VIT1/CCC1 transporter family protein [Candidatus Micrarchaeota archaeon]|nr:VIT1/CCC1 transporter family protein [Candidatus Micrarchaeota archaeon]